MVAISKEVLEVLSCPVCQTRVELTADGKGVKCVNCRRVYPIRDGIAVMLVEEARLEPE